VTPRRATISAAARRDLEGCVLWLRSEAGADMATRFALSASRSLATLAETPGLGTPVATTSPHLSGLRKGRIAGFPKYLVFYLPDHDNIRVLRVLHAHGDWWSLLGVN
jgi:plasmid stabilization system protein ParE